MDERTSILRSLLRGIWNGACAPEGKAQAASGVHGATPRFIDSRVFAAALCARHLAQFLPLIHPNTRATSLRFGAKHGAKAALGQQTTQRPWP